MDSEKAADSTRNVKTPKDQAEDLAMKVRERTLDLEHQLQFNRTLTENAVSGLMLIDEKARIVSMNRAAEKSIGWKLENARGKKLHDLTHHSHPDGTPYSASLCPIESALRGDLNVLNRDETFVTREGKFFPVSYSIAPLKVEWAITGAVLEFRDITEGTKETARLRLSEDRYRRLFETAQDGILILDETNGRIEDANPFLLELLGYSKEELLGKQLWEIGFFKDIDANQEAFKKLKVEGYIRYEDLPLKTKQGESRDVEFVSNSYVVDVRTVIQCNIRDITERKEAERALYISEETVRQSKKMEAMGKLSGGIAHDFNNVLTAINGYASMALPMVELNGTVHNYISEIIKAGERATGMTRQLLAFSRQQILAPKVLGLNAIISDMNGMMDRLIGEAIHIRQNLAPNLGRIKADRVQIQQILMNLVINARDAMPKGGDITISTRNVISEGEFATLHPETAERNFVLLSVRDTGTGMNEETKARAFDPFFTTKQIGKGTGMGLATVQGIVEQSGGYVTLETSPGKGSTFGIYLPLTEMAEDGHPSIPAEADAGERGFETIMLVEDEALVRTFVRTALKSYGYTVMEAHSGAEALAMIQPNHITVDLLLTDLRMPGLTGQDLAREFLVLRPDCTVLFMSGYIDELSVRNGIVEGGNGNRFIQKPFSPAQVARAVREALNQTASKVG
ncbi:MAG: PAS domain S-box protein [Fibrobacterota bacterium]|nr:PAS domain S-box protein [Fibrobacterota bacterium]